MSRPKKPKPFIYEVDPQQLISYGPIVPGSVKSGFGGNHKVELPMRFLLDTGSNVTWVRKGTIKKLGSKIVNTKKVQGIGSKWAHYFFAEWTLGPLGHYHMMLEPTEKEEDLPMPEAFDGLIGRNLMRDLPMTIDWKKGIVKLEWKSWNP